MNDVKRSVVPGRTILDLLDDILVVCPRCSKCARVERLKSEDQPTVRRHSESEHQVACMSCGLSKRREPGGYPDVRNRVPMVDAFFGLPLWLQTPCCGENLWAYNWSHLKMIEEYVDATLREQNRVPGHGWQNSSWINRLPGWMKAAKNRSEVLKGIDRLRQKL